jgi:hypothetical protein
LFPNSGEGSDTDREDSSEGSGGNAGDQRGEDLGDEPDVPQGLKLLWALMHATEETIAASLFRADNVKASATFFELTDTGAPTIEDSTRRADVLIGTGAHGMVYGCATDSTTCIKASRVGETIHIKRELNSLKALNVDKCASIPVLVRVGRSSISSAT